MEVEVQDDDYLALKLIYMKFGIMVLELDIISALLYEGRNGPTLGLRIINCEMLPCP